MENRHRGTKHKATKQKFKESDNEPELKENYLDDANELSWPSPERRIVAPGDDNVAESFVLSEPKLRTLQSEVVSVKKKLSTKEFKEISVPFNTLVEHAFETGIDSAENASDEHLLSSSTLSDLCTEAAKLKDRGAMEMVPNEKLTRLLTILKLNIRGCIKVSPTKEKNIQIIRLDFPIDRVLDAANACLICLIIMTSPNMSKKIYIEEIIDSVVLFMKYHLSITIFPCFDPTYILDIAKKVKKRKKSMPVPEKSYNLLYSKFLKLINLLSELVNIQILTETLVLHASSMGNSTLFYKNINELQLASLKLLTLMFSKYEAFRKLLLNDIFDSISHFSNTKRTLRTYKLNNAEHIQMSTALVMQLIQCVTAQGIPEKKGKQRKKKSGVQQKVDYDAPICTNFRKAMATAATFLNIFLSKCNSNTQEIDYKLIFKNFIQDLFSTVNTPEWPVSEMLIFLLGKMLMQNCFNKETDMSYRLASLNYLGDIALRLCKENLSSKCKFDNINQIVKDIKQAEMKKNNENQSRKNSSEMTRTQFLQNTLLDFLAVNSQYDDSFNYARHFYIAYWYKDLVKKGRELIIDDKKPPNRSLKNGITNEEKGPENAQIIKHKELLLSSLTPSKGGIPTSSEKEVQIFQTFIDYNIAKLIAHFLTSDRYVSSFDQFLEAILIIIKDISKLIRTNAMRCLNLIVEVDPLVLARNDVQLSINQSMLDPSPSVREATVDLIGKFVLRQPELIDKYYQMLSTHILDTGVSVRKRVIRILKDICTQHPAYPKIPEICVNIMKRIDDEEGIRRLVMEIFRNMWFTPTNNKNTLCNKVSCITDVVATSSNLQWFEQLLVCLYKPKDNSTKINIEPPEDLLTACKQIVDYLVENTFLSNDDSFDSDFRKRLSICVSTLLCFVKIRAELLFEHIINLYPYLQLKYIGNDDDELIIRSVAKIIELVVPLINHPRKLFLAQLEDDIVKLICRCNRSIVSSAVSCLGSIVNKVTHNFKLIQNCFKRFNKIIEDFKSHIETSNLEYLDNVRHRTNLRRALFVVGLLIRHFNFINPKILGDLPPETKDRVFKNMIYFIKLDDVDCQTSALKAIGQVCVRHSEFMLEPEVEKFYHRLLITGDAPVYLKVDVLNNMKIYLTEDVNLMMQQRAEWSKRAKKEKLEEMDDAISGMASTVIQQYLQQIMACYLHENWEVRQMALQVIQLIYEQSLVLPDQFIPTLICMSTDTEKYIAQNAEKMLREIESRYPQFVFSQILLGIEMAYKLQTIIHKNLIVRGFVAQENNNNYHVSLHGYLYSLLRHSRQQRRALILKCLQHFDEKSNCSLPYMLYLADNLAHFPYQIQDEVLFLVHHINVIVSDSGTNLLQTLRDALVPDPDRIVDEKNEELNSVALELDDIDDEDLRERLPENLNHLKDSLTAVQGCLLLLILREHIKNVFELNDGKIQSYSPSETAKQHEKPVSKKSNIPFDPKAIVEKLKEANSKDDLDETERRDLISQYLELKRLMLQMDPANDGGKEENKCLTNFVENSSTLTKAKRVAKQNQKDHTFKVPKKVVSQKRSESKPKRNLVNRQTPQKSRRKLRDITSDSETEDEISSDSDSD